MIEDRLQAAFTALADTVDTPPPGLRHPTHRSRAIVGAAAAVLIVAGGAWVALQPSRPGSGPPPTAPPAASSMVSPPVTTPPVTIPYELYTHCGVDEAAIGNSFFEAETPIPEPPNEWGNPYQKGTMTLVSDPQVIFRDDLGHVVRFRLRPGATAFKHICH